MQYSLSQDIKVISNLTKIEKLIIELKDILKDATPLQVKHIKREINQLVARLSHD